MKPGTKRKPTMLAELHGNPRKAAKSARVQEPRPVGNLVESPVWFGPEQQLAWQHAIAHSPPGLLKRIDRAVLAAFIVAEDLHRQACVEQLKIGLVWRPKGSEYPQQSPFLAIINRQAVILARCAAELGFTPSSRSSIDTTPGIIPDAGGTNGKAGQRRQPVSLETFLANAPPRQTTH